MQTVFEPQLSRLDANKHAMTIDLLVIATDVYSWKLLRRDAGLPRERTERSMRYLVDAILASTSEKN